MIIHPYFALSNKKEQPPTLCLRTRRLRCSFTLLHLHSCIKSAERQKVYNLEVYKDHNFLVSTDKILVHNTCWGNKISAIAKKYKIFECVECADDIVSVLKKEGLSGKILNITTTSNQGMLGNIWSERLGRNIATNGRHRAVLVNGKVYDNINPNGVDYDVWKNDLFSPSGYNVTSTDF